MRARWAVSAVLAASACGSPGDAPVDGSTDTDGMGSDAGDGFNMLIQRSWTLGPGLENWYCRRQTITEDMYITGLRPVSPDGTHHEILTIADATKLGNFDCDRANDLPKYDPLLFAGGIGTTDFVFPPGVAVKIPAGTTLQLYLHVSNSSDQTLNKTSGIAVRTVPASDVANEADMMFVGKRTFTIPVPTQMPPESYSLTTSCGAGSDWHIVGLWPHMHQHGIHQKVEIQRAGTTMKTPLDVAYDVNEQRNYTMDFMVPTNDVIAVTCTWLNDTGAPIGSSENTSAEMCYAGAFVYPKVNDLYRCMNN